MTVMTETFVTILDSPNNQAARIDVKFAWYLDILNRWFQPAIFYNDSMNTEGKWIQTRNVFGQAYKSFPVDSDMSAFLFSIVHDAEESDQEAIAKNTTEIIDNLSVKKLHYHGKKESSKKKVILGKGKKA
jgi:hypothetical protein